MITVETNLRTSWPVMEEFYTIQGEGFHTGRAAYFIRLGGCDVGCVWCDVKESWDKNAHPDTHISTLVESVENSGTDFVVLTGGEPAMYSVEALVKTLQKKGIYVAIETSGCYKLDADVDWYCFSPKKFKPPVDESYVKADELKVVIFHPSDLAWAQEHAKLILNKDCQLYLQPEWSKEAQILPLIIEFVKTHPEWRISLQTHKYMNIP